MGVAKAFLPVSMVVLLVACAGDDHSGGGQAWIAEAMAVSDWSCHNTRDIDDSQSTVSCSCTPGVSPNSGDQAPFCFAKHPCCILEQVNGAYSCRCRAWHLVTDQPS